MAVAYFTTWSMFNERNGAKSDVAPTEEGTYIRELGGAEKFLSRKIPGTDKLVCPHGAVYIFDGAVDHDALIDALELSLIRHHLLRSHVVIDAESGKEYFFANKSSISDMAKVILSSKEVPDKDFDSLWRNELEAITNDGIFPAQGPLWWMKNFHTEEKKKTCWIFASNHGINDQKSLNVLVQELLDCVNNNPASSKTEKIKNEKENENKMKKMKNEAPHDDEKTSENDETKTQKTESDDSELKYGPDCLPFPPALEVAVTPSVSIWKILQWAVPQMFYIPPREANFVPTKLLENYKEDPVLYANYGCAQERKTFIECFKLTKKETKELIEVCRFNRVTVTSALSAAVLSLSSSFLQNGTGDDGREEELKTLYLKIQLPVDTRPYGEPFAMEFQEDMVVISDGHQEEKEEKLEKQEKQADIFTGSFDFPSVIHSDNNGIIVEKDKTDWTRGAVMCAIGSIDYIVAVPVKAVLHAREIYNQLRSPDLSINRVEIAMSGEAVEDLDKNPEFWVLAKECRAHTKALVENNLGEHLLYTEFMLKQANLEDTIAAEAANPLTMGRTYHCSVSNVGIAKIKSVNSTNDLDDDDSVVPPILKLRDAYFTTGSAFNGFYCSVYSMTVEDSLCLCLNFTSPVSSREEGLFFKDCFLAMLREQIIKT